MGLHCLCSAVQDASGKPAALHHLATQPDMNVCLQETLGHTSKSQNDFHATPINTTCILLGGMGCVVGCDLSVAPGTVSNNLRARCGASVRGSQEGACRIVIYTDSGCAGGISPDQPDLCIIQGGEIHLLILPFGPLALGLIVQPAHATKASLFGCSNSSLYMNSRGMMQHAEATRVKCIGHINW